MLTHPLDGRRGTDAHYPVEHIMRRLLSKDSGRHGKPGQPRVRRPLRPLVAHCGRRVLLLEEAEDYWQWSMNGVRPRPAPSQAVRAAVPSEPTTSTVGCRPALPCHPRPLPGHRAVKVDQHRPVAGKSGPSRSSAGTSS